jgi:putative endonuclease
MHWIVYILRCADNSLYTGITNDLSGRILKHTKGIGAKYTRSRGPFELVYSEQCATKSQALKREAKIKSLSREQKIALIATSALSIYPVISMD